MHQRTLVIAFVALALALGALVRSGGAGQLEITLDLTLAPKPVVTAGADTLAAAQFANHGSGTLTDVEISFDVPAGSFQSSSPGGCSASGAHVTCAVGTVAAGETVQQFVTFTAPTGADTVSVASTATYRKASQAAHQVFTRTDSDSTGVAAAGNPDLVGTCASSPGTLATAPTAGAANPQSTSLVFSDSTQLPCTPVSVGEQQRTAANPGCPSGETCTTEVSFVTIPALPEPARVTISFERHVLEPGTKPKNFVLWETPDKYPAEPIRRVQACPLPPGEDSCIVEISRYNGRGIQVVLQVVGTGDDPRYAG